MTFEHDQKGGKKAHKSGLRCLALCLVTICDVQRKKEALTNGSFAPKIGIDMDRVLQMSVSCVENCVWSESIADVTEYTFLAQSIFRCVMYV